MTEVFGDALVNAPIEGRPRIDRLPSPENLKGRVLLKARVLCHPLKIGTRWFFSAGKEFVYIGARVVAR